MSNTNASYSTDKIFYLALDYRNGTHKLRADLTGGAKATNGSGYGDGQWHTLVLTSRADNPTFGVSVDGVSVLSYSQAAFKGLFTRLVNADQLQIGGYKPADTVYEGFKGEISQVAISSEALTTAQANALTSAEQSRFKKTCSRSMKSAIRGCLSEERKLLPITSMYRACAVLCITLKNTPAGKSPDRCPQLSNL
ncbi:LamG domain-containing protein [Allobaculum sp. Allo2]|uniref:LamG domain-containing protein n=1 Tax=Allobaculum sp. Allo2 TaxID=2853432 RepID=UPI001F616A93|nr:LamG domain-containing protein [Allobaculum sp. Allo2]UNT92525.1 hypothetical protein KWG61_10220 [Allobaculum sp. Allo2]